MIGAEYRYIPIEKECLALVFAIQKMRHYLSGQTIHVISRVNPLKILMTKPGSLNCRLAKWALLLSPYDIHFVPQKVMKGQTIADFLADHPFWSDSRLSTSISKQTPEVNTSSQEQPWQMFFDGAARWSAAGVGVVLISSQKHILPNGYSLTEPCTNNVAEYSALMIGLKMALQLGVNYLKVYGDSKLIVNQMTGEYEVIHKALIPYHQLAVELAGYPEQFYIYHIPRHENIYADALAALAAILAIPSGTAKSITIGSRELLYSNTIFQTRQVCQASLILESHDW